MTNPVYTDPGELAGRLGVVNTVAGGGHPYHWYLEIPGPCIPWVWSVRRPTEAELAAWALQDPGGAHG